MSQCCPNSLTHICGTKGRWDNCLINTGPLWGDEGTHPLWGGRQIPLNKRQQYGECFLVMTSWNKQRVLMHGHQGWNVRHGLCHIYMIYVYIWVVHSFCLFCCLFIIVTTQFVALYEPCKPKPKPSTYDTRTTTPCQRSKFRYLDRSQSNKSKSKSKSKKILFIVGTL